MKYKNSFFKININDNSTYIEVFPPLSDGKRLSIQEVLGYLKNNNIPCDNISKIEQALMDVKDAPMKILLCDHAVEKINESVKITISPDNLVAYIRFYPPSTGGSVMNKKEILAELERENIKFGIQDKVIDVFLMARQYCLNIPIAKGKKPVPATDTKIEYFFNTKPLAKPKMLEDGSVDFHELNMFTSVKKGDVLAKLTEHTVGEPGTTIFGVSIPQNKPKVKHLKYGRNIRISDDKKTLVSDVDGDVSLTDGTVFVSDTYMVAADVDASTGDIDYEGNVHITGNVRTGFTVRARSDIQVNGVVEGAVLEAGGNIVIKRGVQGMTKGILKAGGDICAQFFESANVEAGQDIIVGSILHSNVFSGGKITVSGRKGFIVGGEVICDTYLEVNSIGNKVETQTMIKVGVKPQLYDEMKQLVSEVNELNEQYDEISSYINVYKTKLKNGLKLTPENIKKIKSYKDKLEELEEEKQPKSDRLKEIKAELEYGKKGSVKVLGNTYRGVTIFISNQIYTVKEKDIHSWYKIVNGEVIPTTI